MGSNYFIVGVSGGPFGIEDIVGAGVYEYATMAYCPTNIPELDIHAPLTVSHHLPTTSVHTPYIYIYIYIYVYLSVCFDLTTSLSLSSSSALPGGPLFALLGFSMLLVWSVPEALITAELSTTFPEASGFVAWVTAAFGPFWG
jgi:hypothetical protein